MIWTVKYDCFIYIFLNYNGSIINGLFIEIKVTSKISDVLFDDRVVTKGGNTNKFVCFCCQCLSEHIAQYFQSDFLPVYCQNKKMNTF